MMIAYEICDFAIGCGDGDYWPASGGDTVELAWDNEPFKLRFERQPVHVRNAKRVFEKGTLLIGDKAKACCKTARVYEVCKFIEVVGTAKITGIADHEFVLEPPQFS